MGLVGQVAPRWTAALEVVGIVWPIPSSPQVMGWILQSVRTTCGSPSGQRFAAPAAAPAARRRGASSCSPRPSRGMNHDTPATILVAEDDATTRTFLAD